MTRIFIHVEANLNRPSKPYRLAACTADRSRVFEANIAWPEIDVFPDDLSRVFKFGQREWAGDDESLRCYGSALFVSGLFQMWVEACGGDTEYWTKSHQSSWRELNALGLHVLPIYDLSTFVRLQGCDFAVESVKAHRDAIVKAGATSPRCGAYEQAIIFENVRRKLTVI